MRQSRKEPCRCHSHPRGWTAMAEPRIQGLQVGTSPWGGESWWQLGTWQVGCLVRAGQSGGGCPRYSPLPSSNFPPVLPWPKPPGSRRQGTLGSVTPITFAIFSALQVGHQIQPKLKGRGLHREVNPQRQASRDSSQRLSTTPWIAIQHCDEMLALERHTGTETHWERTRLCACPSRTLSHTLIAQMFYMVRSLGWICVYFCLRCIVEYI